MPHSYVLGANSYGWDSSNWPQISDFNLYFKEGTSAGGSVVEIPCPGGTFSTAGATSCTSCAAGSYSNAGASSCTPYSNPTCEANEYQIPSTKTSDRVCGSCRIADFEGGLTAGTNSTKTRCTVTGKIAFSKKYTCSYGKQYGSHECWTTPTPPYMYSGAFSAPLEPSPTTAAWWAADLSCRITLTENPSIQFYGGSGNVSYGAKLINISIMSGGSNLVIGSQNYGVNIDEHKIKRADGKEGPWEQLLTWMPINYKTDNVHDEFYEHDISPLILKFDLAPQWYVREVQVKDIHYKILCGKYE